MIAKIRAIFTTPSGISLIGLFIYFGLKGIESHFTGSVGADIGMIVSALGVIFHPVDMTGGYVIKR